LIDASLILVPLSSFLTFGSHPKSHITPWSTGYGDPSTSPVGLRFWGRLTPKSLQTNWKQKTSLPFWSNKARFQTWPILANRLVPHHPETRVLSEMGRCQSEWMLKHGCNKKKWLESTWIYWWNIEKYGFYYNYSNIIPHIWPGKATRENDQTHSQVSRRGVGEPAVPGVRVPRCQTMGKKPQKSEICPWKGVISPGKNVDLSMKTWVFAWKIGSWISKKRFFPRNIGTCSLFSLGATLQENRT